MPKLLNRSFSYLLVALAGAAVSGCAQIVSPPLPELPKLPDNLLSASEQRKAIADLEQKKQLVQADASKQASQAR